MKYKVMKLALASLLMAGGLVGFVSGPASAATIVGTPNLTTYCKTNVGGVWYATTLSLVSPYYWRCTNSYTGALLSIDVNKACRQQFGQSSWSTVVAYHPNGWRCVR